MIFREGARGPFIMSSTGALLQEKCEVEIDMKSWVLLNWLNFADDYSAISISFLKDNGFGDQYAFSVLILTSFKLFGDGLLTHRY